jgi:hypothetical protein
MNANRHVLKNVLHYRHHHLIVMLLLFKMIFRPLLQSAGSTQDVLARHQCTMQIGIYTTGLLKDPNIYATEVQFTWMRLH